MMLERALEHLRQNIEPGIAGCRFKRALDEALGMSNLSGAERAAIPLGDPVDSWPQKGSLIHSLWDFYASVLDIRVEGKADDYMLWNAVDVRTMFGTLADPDCEHLCIAILVMEGAIADIAWANWDGLIERAVERLSGGGRLLQVVVDPDHLRDPAGRTRLIKFHGCAIYARDDPGTYRHFLTATRPQITDWPHNARLDALRTVLRSVATNSRTLMIGLSLQDTTCRIYPRLRGGRTFGLGRRRLLHKGTYSAPMRSALINPTCCGLSMAPHTVGTAPLSRRAPNPGLFEADTPRSGSSYIMRQTIVASDPRVAARGQIS